MRKPMKTSGAVRRIAGREFFVETMNELRASKMSIRWRVGGRINHQYCQHVAQWTLGDGLQRAEKRFAFVVSRDDNRMAE
jgi:hypothetical protein